MKMILRFDVDADMLEVPQYVIDNRDRLQKKFTNWLYDKNTRHKYWVRMQDRSGNTFTGVCYRGDAFVEWLNKKVLAASDEKARVVEVGISEYPKTLPVLYF